MRSLILAVAFLWHSSAVAEEAKYRYRIYLGGMPLGNLNVESYSDTERYEGQGEFVMTAFLRIFLDNDASARVSGVWAEDGRPVPQNFSFKNRDRKKHSSSVMHFDEEGRPVGIDITPPRSPRPYDISIEEAKDAVDPATAIVLLAKEREQPCDIKLDIFDGRKLHRLTVDEEESREGGLIYCKGLYERVAGFRPKDMTDERRTYPFETRLKQGDMGWYPDRISAKTAFGVAVALLRPSNV